MSDTDSQQQTPFRPLGRHLKELRVKANESLAEASGAVEIDVRELAGFELGKDRPSEDVLLLLISHFGAKDEEAVRIWETAGYATEKTAAGSMDNTPVLPSVGTLENRVLFTDVVDIVVNNYGVVMNFMQAGPVSSTNSVARVGMSREHAKSILNILQNTLNQTETNSQKAMPPVDHNGEQTKN